jgi:hypothetical protein
MNLEIVIFVECDFVCIEDVESASGSPKIAGKDVALCVVLVG